MVAASHCELMSVAAPLTESSGKWAAAMPSIVHPGNRDTHQESGADALGDQGGPAPRH